MKKIVIILISIVITFLIFILGFRLFVIKDYNSAKKSSIKFLNSNQIELEKIYDKIILNNQENASGRYKEKFYIYYSNDEKYIKLDIDSQGMLGGQYWGIIYCPSDDLIDNNYIEIYDENTETNNGNNIFIKERIKENWYFYYDDYDGKVDIKEIEGK